MLTRSSGQVQTAIETFTGCILCCDVDSIVCHVTGRLRALSSLRSLPKDRDVSTSRRRCICSTCCGNRGSSKYYGSRITASASGDGRLPFVERLCSVTPESWERDDNIA
jgi:hypothetical protein